MSLFEELKRRNVFRVGFAYLVGAWLLIQFADILLDNMQAPAWVLQAIMVALAIGLFITLLVAWAFELTPEGIKRESQVDRSQSITPQTGKKLNNAIVALLVLAVAWLLYDKFSKPAAEPVTVPAVTTTLPAEEPQAEPVERLSIAVLPFSNRSNREEDQFFTDGIHDDLLTTIARIGSMKVISRTSVMEYRDTTKKIPEIARELGVANILEGGIQRSGNTVRINVQLIEASTDEHLWAEIFDRELTAENLFAIQSEISKRIAEALQATLSPQQAAQINRMPTDNLEAYDAYHRGKLLMATRRVADLQQATQAFQNAVELDPDFALAWVGLADSHALLRDYSYSAVADSADIRRQAIERALAIDPDLGEAYASLGTLHDALSEPEAAEAAFRKAIELSPNYATAYHWYGNFLALDESRADERLALAYKAVELDPRSLIISANLAQVFRNQGLFSKFEQQVRKQIEIDPRFPNSYHQLLDHQLWSTGELAKALINARTLADIDPKNVDALRHQIEVFVEIGDRKAADALQQRIQELDPASTFAAWSDLYFALRDGNAPAARETINWMLQNVPSEAYMTAELGYASLAIGDVPAARELLLRAQPGWLERDAWENRIAQSPVGACTVAWVLMHTGDEALGQELLVKSLDFHERQLPAAVEHADRYSPERCYLANGDTEKALDSLETQLAHGHMFQWEIQFRMPVYDSIRSEPRFQALLAEREEKIQAQREAIAALDAEAGA